MPDRPNVLVILADQLRRSALGHAGDPNVSTPEIDALAAGGARATAACSTYPACVPARATLMTGRPAHAFNAYGHDFRLSPSEQTLGDAFRDAGFWTGYVGKWHLHGYGGLIDDRRGAGRAPIPEEYHGFEHWRGFEYRNQPYDTCYFEDDDPEPVPMEGHQTDGITDLGLDLLADASGDDRPFLLCLSYEAPHPPTIAPPEYHDRWRDVSLTLPPDVDAALGRGDLPGSIFGPDGARSYAAAGDLDGSDTLGETTPSYHRDVFLDDVRGYYAMIEHLDANVRRLREHLAAEDLLDSTVVLLTSDHGELLGRHGYMKKRLPHEAAAGVPFLVSGPGIPEERTVTDPIHTEDVYPTLLGLAGIGGGPTVGEDLTPVLSGTASELDRAGVPLEHVTPTQGGGPWRAFRTERYKYSVRDGSPWHLFDLEEDPLELDNLIDDPDCRDTAARLHGLLRSHLETNVDTYELDPAFGYDGLHRFDTPAGPVGRPER